MRRMTVAILIGLAAQSCVTAPPPGAVPPGAPPSVAGPQTLPAPLSDASGVSMIRGTLRAAPANVISNRATLIGSNGGTLIGSNGGTLVGSNGGTLVGSNGGMLIGSNGGTLVGSNGGTIVSNSGGTASRTAKWRQAYRLLGLEESVVADAEVRLIDLSNPAAVAAVTRTDKNGDFRVKRPQKPGDWIIEAHFLANGAPIAYEAPLPGNASDSGDAPLLVDTASTLLAARWRESLKAGRRFAKKLPDSFLKRFRDQLNVDNIPYMGRDSDDLAATFDQIIADDPGLRQSLDGELGALGNPERPWMVQTWKDNAILRKLGGLSTRQEFTRNNNTAYTIGPDGSLYLLLPESPPVIKRITPDDTVTTIATLAPTTRAPYAMAFSSKRDLYVTSSDTQQMFNIQRLEKDSLTVLNRIPLERSSTPPVSGRLAVTGNGDIYWTQAGRHLIWYARSGAPVIERYAGSADGREGFENGFRLSSRFANPYALALTSDDQLLVTDRDNHCVRRIDSTGQVTTLVGEPGDAQTATAPLRFGRGLFTRLGDPTGLAIHPNGMIFFNDAAKRRVMRLSPFGSVFAVAGNGEDGPDDGTGPKARFGILMGLDLDDAGRLYLEDVQGVTNRSTRLRRIERQ